MRFKPPIYVTSKPVQHLFLMNNRIGLGNQGHSKNDERERQRSGSPNTKGLCDFWVRSEEENYLGIYSMLTITLNSDCSPVGRRSVRSSGGMEPRHLVAI